MKKEPAPRFTDSGAPLEDYATHFLVACPRCAGRAEVRPFGAAQRLTCLACHHVENAGRWYGAVRLTARRKCPDCGAPVEHVSTGDAVRGKIVLHCGACGGTSEAEPVVTPLPYRDGLKTDPVFGLPLLLQTDFRGELFWAYNFEHLAYLRAYIAADLRERGIDPRNTIRKNSSLASRLPAFVKQAANREGLLKVVDALFEGRTP